MVRAEYKLMKFIILGKCERLGSYLNQGLI